MEKIKLSIDINGNPDSKIIKVTDLEKAKEQAKTFVEISYNNGDKKKILYWEHVLFKLSRLEFNN